jgi:endonuclease/exonuclease/phosphatase family metal-dependent hydrolase
VTSVFARITTILFVLGGCAPPSGTGATTGAAPPPFAEPRGLAQSTGGFTVATFNAEFLFDGLDPDGGATFPWKGDTAAARRHREDVARVVRDVDADVIVLVEVEHLDILRTMIRRELAGLGYSAYLIDGRDTFTGQDVGVLSRFTARSVYRTNERASVPGDSPYGVSKNIIIRFDAAGMPVSLIGVHFLAQADSPERRPRREAQAEVIRRAVVREMAAGREVIVAGDFNDYDPAVPDVAGSAAITDVLAIVRSAGEGPADDLHSALQAIPRARRYTVGRDRDGDGIVEPHEAAAIDHVLLSPALARRMRDAHVAHTPAHGAVSDHWPLVVTIGPD